MSLLFKHSKKVFPSIVSSIILTFDLEVRGALHPRPRGVGPAPARVVCRVHRPVHPAPRPGLGHPPSQHGLDRLEVVGGGVGRQGRGLHPEPGVVVAQRDAVLQPGEGAQRRALDAAADGKVLL